MIEGKNSKVIKIKTDNYTMENLEYYFAGDLKGYANGYIEFSNGKIHELLYRIYDPENGYSNKLVSIDYGFENPMVEVYWDEIEAKITSSVIGVIEASLQEDKVPITADQALACLVYAFEKKVHSFTKSVFLSGADIEFERVKEIITGAASMKMLFISSEMGKALNHNIVAWDHLYQEWIYLKCVPEMINKLQ